MTIDLEYILSTFEEHTRSISSVRWNPNRISEFASTSHDGLVKLWDIRLSSVESSITLHDREAFTKKGENERILCGDWNTEEVDYVTFCSTSIFLCSRLLGCPPVFVAEDDPFLFGSFSIS